MESPTFRQLEYAVYLAEYGHFGRAAEAVHVSQPGLSSQIRELERRLDIELFERAPRRVSLTPAGAEVIERSRRILRQVHELRLTAAAHHDSIRGRLQLAVIPTMAPYILPVVVRSVHDHWPEAHLDIQELQTSQVVVAIERGEIDLGLLAVPYDTGSLHVEPLTHEPFHLALPENHDLVGADPLPIHALTGLQMLLLPEGHCLRDHARHACEIAGQVDHSEIHAASLSTLTQMVAAGIGVTLLPASAIGVEARAGTGIATRPLQPPAPGRTIALTWRTSDPRSRLYADLPSLLAGRLQALVSAAAGPGSR